MSTEVTLVTGEKVNAGLLRAIYTSLTAFLEDGDIVAVYDLMRASNDPAYRPLDSISRRLHAATLLQQWDPATGEVRVQPEVAAIVRAAVRPQPGGVILAGMRSIIQR